MTRRTYLDSGVLIQAWLGDGPTAERATAILNDPDREFVYSEFVALELLPTTSYHRDFEQRTFYEAYQARSATVAGLERIVNQAHIEGAACGAAGIDACHLGAAVLGGVDELITTEKPIKPMCRSKTVPVVSIRWAGQA